VKRILLLAFASLLLTPLYGQINFGERVNMYDIDSLSIDIIHDDFDADGDLDIIKYRTFNERNVLLQKNDNGDWSLPTFIADNVNPIISLDINNDGYPDLITYSSYTTIGVLYNLQNDTFSAEQTLINFSGSYSISPLKFDYNTDGFMDLVVTNNQDNTYVLLNNQNGGFLPQQFLLATGSAFASVYKIDDFDSDGDFDFYVSNQNLKVYLNTNGTFVSSNLLQAEGNAFEEYGILDLDGNGYSDILYWKYGAIWAKYFGLHPITNQLAVLNDVAVVEDIPFSSSSNNDRSLFIKTLDTGIHEVYLALETTSNASNIYKFTIDNGVFSTADVVLSNFDINSFYLLHFEFLDLNNNGAIDFSFASNFNSQNMLLVNYDIDNPSDTTLCIQQTIVPDKFTVIDMNGDGIEDVCVGVQNGLGYYEKISNNEHHGIKNLIGVMSDPNASMFTLNYILDIDNDGLGDVIDYHGTMHAKVFKNMGNDNFLYIQTVPIDVLTSGMFFADLDNDGYHDLVFKKNPYLDGDALLWARNNGGIDFEEVQGLTINYPNPIDAISLAFEDFNNDGSTDIVLLNNYYDNDNFINEVVFLANQDGLFSSTNVVNLTGNYSEGTIKIKDLDQDGDLDFFVYGLNNAAFCFYRNNGQNVFQKIVIDYLSIYDIEFDDNNGNGKYEIYAINYVPDSYTSNIIYYSSANFVSYSKTTIDSYWAYNDWQADLLLFDYNNDTKKDLLVINSDFINGTIWYYQNNSISLATEEHTNGQNLKVYPNPFMDAINWSGENKNYHLQVFTANGVLIHQERTSNNSLDLSFLSGGIYLLVMEDTDSHTKSTHKIIKR